MALLDDKTRTQVQEHLRELKGPVNLVLFTRGDDEMSGQAGDLLDEIRSLDERISVEKHDLDAAPELAFRYGIQRAPAIVVEGERDYGIRYYGAPTGYEFGSLIEVMVDVSRGRTDLPEPLRAELSKIDKPVHIQVFVTPT